MQARHIVMILIFLWLWNVRILPAQSEHFEVTTLPNWQGQTFEPHAINDRGQVVGLIHLGTGKWHLFLWEHPTGLKNLGPVYPNPLDINNRGQIVGTAMESGDKRQAFLREPDGTVTILGDFGGGDSEATAINNQGQVVGRALGGVYQAFTWDRADGMRALNVPGRFRGRATAISDTGQVFGALEYHDPINLRQRPCCWEMAHADGPEAIEVPGSDFFAMNGKGWIVGQYVFRNGGPHVVLWHARGGIKRLFPCDPDDGVYERSTWLVNDANQVVCVEEGYQSWGQDELESASFQPRRFLWDPAEGKISLDQYLPPQTRAFDVRDLNNRGCILGIAHLDDDNRRVPLLLEPKSWRCRRD